LGCAGRWLFTGGFVDVSANSIGCVPILSPSPFRPSTARVGIKNKRLATGRDDSYLEQVLMGK